QMAGRRLCRCREQMGLRLLRDGIELLLIAHHREVPGLLVDGAGCPGGSVDQAAQHSLAHQIGCELPHGSPSVDRLDDVHAYFLLGIMAQLCQPPPGPALAWRAAGHRLRSSSGKSLISFSTSPGSSRFAITSSTARTASSGSMPSPRNTSPLT